MPPALGVGKTGQDGTPCLATWDDVVMPRLQFGLVQAGRQTPGGRRSLTWEPHRHPLPATLPSQARRRRQAACLPDCPSPQ